MVDAAVELERGRDLYAREAWAKAFQSLSAADQARPLEPDDLELLANCAYMLGRDDDYIGALERAHHAYVGAGDVPRAVRCAWWIGHNLLFRGETARASGWFGRGQRLLEDDGRDCVERGYLLIPVWLEQLARGDYDAGYETAVAAAEIARRFGDTDLLWLSVDEQGRALLKQGRVKEGLRLVDEAMVAAAAGELSSIVTGIVYCNTIGFCQSVFQLRHAREWTEALMQWCARQPEMVEHNGICRVHRSEIMQLQGAWRDALEEAREAARRFGDGALNRLACGRAFYQQGEIRRLWGEFDAAEEAYRAASRHGYEPQPGLALLRLAQGKADAAAAAIRRVLVETSEPLKRAALLPAYIEIILAVGDLDEARYAAREIEQASEAHASEVLHALSAQARGAVALAEGDAPAALVALRTAAHVWQDLAAPYEAARTRELVSLACRALGDDDSADLELDAARAVFEQLGAAADLSRVGKETSVRGHGLSARELQVLKLVATGMSNRKIAAELVLSERTVDRHLSNIFTKLRVSSRAAATAYAYEHDLVGAGGTGR